MKKIILILTLCLIILVNSVKASLPLSGKQIIIDIGHGGKDVGTLCDSVYEKDINLSIAKQLEDELIKNGATVLLVRDDDYDLSSPNARHRKRSDFDNRVKFINESKSDLYLSIHINYLKDKNYKGAQVFYLDNNEYLANNIQKYLNMISPPRSVKRVPDVYMYKRLKIKGVLIECGFISNEEERRKLQEITYQNNLAKYITKGIIDYYK